MATLDIQGLFDVFKTNPGQTVNKPKHFLKKKERCRNCTQRAGTLCAILTCEELDLMDDMMTWVYIKPGQTIFTEGDDLDYYYNVAEGVIRLVKILPDGRRAILDFLFKGDFLGLYAKGNYAYSAEAITQVKLCRFPKLKLQALFKVIPKMESQLFGMFSNKLVTTQNRIVDLARKSPRERLAGFLLTLIEKNALKIQDGAWVLPLGHEDISDYLGLTIWTISRTFSAFTREGLIVVEKGKKIRLKNEAELRKLAEICV